MVDLEGLEPPTPWFEAKCSIQLSYRSVPLRREESGAGWKITLVPACFASGNELGRKTRGRV